MDKPDTGMSIKDFSSKMIQLFMYGDNPGLSSPFVSMLEKWLDGYTGEQIEEIYDLFVTTYKSNHPPKTLYPFDTIVKDNGIEKRTDKGTNLYQKCSECGTVFSTASNGCTLCGKRTLRILETFKTYQVEKLKPNCYQCKVYQAKHKCLACAEWGDKWNGIETDGGRARSANCEKCPCKICCVEEYAVRNKDYDLLHRVTGIDKSVKDEIRGNL